MQAPVWVARFVGWRWTPSVVLVSGSLAFVALAVAIVPEDFGVAVSGRERLTRTPSSRLGTNAASANDEPTSNTGDESRSLARMTRRAIPAAEPPGDSAPSNVVQSIFHSAPKVELPIEPVDPSPQPPPPPPPPPPPTATTFTLQTPPPAPTPAPTAVVPEPPSEPQGITGRGITGE
ncbi:MAG TPA: hypothetical protein VFZ53_09070 [Polyangiaceae bacterium]